MVTISTGDNGVSVHDEDNQWERLGGKIEGLDLSSETYEEDKAHALEQYEVLLVAQKEINQRQSGIVVEQEFQEKLNKQGRIISNLVTEVKRQKEVGEAQAELIQGLYINVEEQQATTSLMHDLLVEQGVDIREMSKSLESFQKHHEEQTEGFVEATASLTQRVVNLRDRVSKMEMAGGEPESQDVVQPKSKKKDKTAQEIVDQEAA